MTTLRTDMGQGDCLEYLEERGEWVKTCDIAEHFEKRSSNVSVPLSGLFKQGCVERRMLRQRDGYEWKAV